LIFVEKRVPCTYKKWSINTSKNKNFWIKLQTISNVPSYLPLRHRQRANKRELDPYFLEQTRNLHLQTEGYDRRLLTDPQILGEEATQPLN
jgi:hypothetical protein